MIEIMTDREHNLESHNQLKAELKKWYRTLELNYKFIDNGHSKTLMLLHGFLQSHKSMLAMSKHLSDLRNIILVDLPGFGASKSVGHDYNMKDVTDGLKNILVQLDIERVDVLGYSMGGRTALAFSLEHTDCVSALYLESASRD